MVVAISIIVDVDVVVALRRVALRPRRLSEEGRGAPIISNLQQLLHKHLILRPATAAATARRHQQHKMHSTTK